MSKNQDNMRQHEGDSDEQQQVKRVRWDFDYNDLITVLIGEEEEPFQIHKDTICERSKFFAAAVSTDRWLEGQEKVVRLPEANARSFQTYMHWMSHGKIFPEVFWQRDDVCIMAEQQTYFYLYILGDIIDDKELHTHALDICISKSVHWEYVPCPQACERVWDRTPKGSPLRTFVLEWMVARMGKSSFSGYVEHLLKEVLEELFVLLMSHEETGRMEGDKEFADRIRAKLLPERP